MTKQQAEKKTVKFETEVSKLLDIVANSLYTEKEIFLRELISNSSDACEKLRYVSQTDSKAPKTNKFQIRIHLNEKNKTISIKDNGIGIDEKMIGKIFEPYFTTKTKGTGLGLSIVKRIIEDHGGKIKIEKNKNMAGTTSLINFEYNA